MNEDHRIEDPHYCRGDFIEWARCVHGLEHPDDIKDPWDDWCSAIDNFTETHSVSHQEV